MLANTCQEEYEATEEARKVRRAISSSACGSRGEGIRGN